MGSFPSKITIKFQKAGNNLHLQNFKKGLPKINHIAHLQLSLFLDQISPHS